MSPYKKLNPWDRQETRAEVLGNSDVTDAMARVERAAWALVKEARWYSLTSTGKINQLRRPLLALKLARRKERVRT